MSEFKNKSITTKGTELISKALSGGKIEFTRIVMGNGTFSGDVGSAESVVSIKQSLPVNKIGRKGTMVTLSTSLLVEQITSDFYWKEVGVYARGSDNKEVLYMYGYTDNASFVSKESLNEKLINIGVLVSNAENVTATIDDSIVYLTLQGLNEHDADSNAHADIRLVIEQVRESVNNIDVSWDGITGKPSVFQPAPHNHSKGEIHDFAHKHNRSDINDFAHGHSAGEISGLPTSLPANGGNADTVDGKHASDFVNLRGGAVDGALKFYTPSANAENGMEGGNGDSASFDACNLDLFSWHGIGFYPITGGTWGNGKAGRSVVIDPRTGYVKARGGMEIQGRNVLGEIDSLKSSVVNGKQAVVNAINDKAGKNTGLTTNNTHDDYAWHIRNTIPSLPTPPALNEVISNLIWMPTNSRRFDSSNNWMLLGNSFFMLVGTGWNIEARCEGIAYYGGAAHGPNWKPLDGNARQLGNNYYVIHNPNRVNIYGRTTNCDEPSYYDWLVSIILQ